MILLAISFYDGVKEGFEKDWHSFLNVLPKGAIAILVITLSIILAQWVKGLFHKKVWKHAKDPLMISFISQITKWVMILTGIVLGVEILGFNNLAGSLVAGAGISAFVIGFAFKDIGENFLAGIIIAFNRNFHIQDTIRIDNYEGDVIAVSLRNVHIRTSDGNDVFIPNSNIINNVLINITATGLTRKDFTICIDYNDDIEKAAELIIARTKKVEGIINEKSPEVNVDSFTNNGVILRISFWYNSLESHKGIINLQSQVMKSIKDILLSEGFVIPGNIQEFKDYRREGNKMRDK